MAVLTDAYHGRIVIPDWVKDHSSFRQWVHESITLPEKLPIHYLNSDVWIDFSPEALDHNQIRSALCGTLAKLIRDEDLGMYVAHGAFWTNERAGFSTEPDAMFIYHETIRNGRINFLSGPRGEATELVGTPDLVIEVVSRNSVEKDTDWLFENYYGAGIPEYWLIDARGKEIRFDIFRHKPKSYQATKRSAGWLKSNVLGKSFKLTRTIDRSKWRTISLKQDEMPPSSPSQLLLTSLDKLRMSNGGSLVIFRPKITHA